MRLFHLNCGSFQPYWPRIHSLVYCLLLETDNGLLLVDTGFGVEDYRRPTRFTRTFTRLLRLNQDEGQTAVAQVKALGYAPDDVQHIVMTHLHIDHAGGLRDFPDAKIHVHAREHQAIMQPRGFKERFYVADHWAHGPRWVIHQVASRQWFGWPSIPILPGVRPVVQMIPLPGHSRGHCAVAIETDSGWLLHCGDATYPFFHDGHPDQPIDSPPEWLVSRLLGPHTPRLRALQRQHGDEIEMICSHDPVSFAINQAASS
jgi:glyoxylase-like metal-dependent hydrolase (beta-lactamase superfamily II)